MQQVPYRGCLTELSGSLNVTAKSVDVGVRSGEKNNLLVLQWENSSAEDVLSLRCLIGIWVETN